MGGRGVYEILEEFKPAAAMVIVQTAFAGVNILYKLALNDGMDIKILVAYRFLFAACTLSPIAFFVERKRRPTLTWKVFGESFFCGLFGWVILGTLSQNFYVAGMKKTSVTFASAMTNLIPAITFILAVLCRLEKLGIDKSPGQAKVTGTILGICGAMVLTFYKGPDVSPWSSSINLLKLKTDDTMHMTRALDKEPGNRVLGSLLSVASCLSYALWLIIQAKVSKLYPCPYSSTALMCSLAAIQSIILALITTRNDISAWKMEFDIRLLTVAFSGIVASGMMFTLMAWCIERKGPLYASIFNPLMLVIVAIVGSFLLNERLHLGSILGSCLIVVGLYIVLWGKRKEAPKTRELAIESMRGPMDVVIVPGASMKHILPQKEEFDIEHQVAFAAERKP